MANLGNFGTSLVATAPSPATSGTSLIVTTGEGALYTSTPFYATAHPANEVPVSSNSEVVLVTNISTDTLTITRAQKGSTAKSIAVGWRISNAIYAEDIRNGSYINNEVPGGTVNGSNVNFTTALYRDLYVQEDRLMTKVE